MHDEARGVGGFYRLPSLLGALMNTDTAAGYFAALIDGEGCVSVARRPWVARSVRIEVTDREIIVAASEACLILGIEHHLPRPRTLPSGKTAWSITINRVAAWERLLELPIRHPRKRSKLEEGVATAHRSLRPSRDILERLYVFEGRSSGEIGALIGVDDLTVIRWLRDYEIPVRSRSEAAFKGHETRVRRRGTRKTGKRS